MTDKPANQGFVLRLLLVSAVVLGAAGLGWWWWVRDTASLLGRAHAELRAALDLPPGAERIKQARKGNEAINSYLSRSGPEHTSALCYRAAAMLLLNQGDEVRGVFAEIDPFGASTPALLILAESLRAAGQSSGAPLLVETALSRTDDRPGALRMAAMLAGDLGRDQGVMRYAREWAELAPDDPGPWRMMALMNAAHNDPEQAIEAFREEAKRGAGLSADDRLELVNQLILVGNAAEARQEWELLPPDPDLKGRKLVESRLLLLEGSREAALAAAEALLAESPEDVEALVQAGRLELILERNAAAERRLRQAVKQAPWHIEGLFQLSRAQAALGRETEAAETLERYRERREIGLKLTRLESEAARNPNDADLRRQIAKLYRESGLTEQARFWARAAMAIDGKKDAP